MAALLAVRSGQTTWDQMERFKGRTDLPLDETGLKQAEAVARRIAADNQPAALCTSPLERAVQTSEIIARYTGLRLQPCEGLLDLGYGDLTGQSPVDVRTRNAGFYKMWLAAPHSVRLPNGESLTDVRERVTGPVHQVSVDHPQETVVLVSHQAVCRVLLCCFLDIHNGYAERFQVDSCSHTVCQVEARASRLVCANDTWHLIPKGQRHLEESTVASADDGGR